MKTLSAIAMLIFWGVIANFVSVIILNFAGIPGALLAGTPNKRSRMQFMLGSLIAALGQSYVYLAFVAFVVNWTMLATKRADIIGFLLWPVAFIVAYFPLWVNLIHARLEAREAEHANPQVEALHITVLIVLIGFFVFAFVPSIMRFAWGWLPYM